MAFVIRTAVQGVSAGMGLVGEKYHDSKERRAALAEEERSSDRLTSIGGQVNSMEPGQETSNDERIWTLDEAASDPPSYDESEAQQPPVAERTVSQLVQNVFASPVPQQDRPTRLPYPIIIPQRRPGSKGRGFARAYPPDMDAFGFDGAAFLRFLQSFQDASEASPWLQALFVSAQVVGLVPGAITMAVSLSISITAGYASPDLISSQLTSRQYGDRVAGQIQSKCLPRSDEQGHLHAYGSILHGTTMQRRA